MEITGFNFNNATKIKIINYLIQKYSQNLFCEYFFVY